MAEGKYHQGEQIVELVATETLTEERMHVDSIILTGSAAGTFVFDLGETTLTFYTVSPLLTLQLYFYRTVNFLELTSGPAGATLFALLHKAIK